MYEEAEEKTDEISLTYRKNRSYELHLGKEVIKFLPKETKILSREILDHKDFEQAAKNFVIKEIE